MLQPAQVKSQVLNLYSPANVVIPDLVLNDARADAEFARQLLHLIRSHATLNFVPNSCGRCKQLCCKRTRRSLVECVRTREEACGDFGVCERKEISCSG